MSRMIVFVYGIVSYGIFLATFLYAVGFVGNVAVARSIDGPVTSATREALVVNLVLLAMFAVQHSVMARKPFKRWLERFVPQAAERSTYVLASSVALLVLFWQWRPIAGDVWDVESATGRHPLYVGWLLAFWAAPTMTIAHFFFAMVTTAYILAAIQLEERDLVADHGASYDDYRRRVPMLVPRLGRPTPVPRQAPSHVA